LLIADGLAACHDRNQESDNTSPAAFRLSLSKREKLILPK